MIKKAEADASAIGAGDALDLKCMSIGTRELEDSYPLEFVNEFLATIEITEPWSPPNCKFKTMLKKHNISDFEGVGKTKADLARFIASKIVSMENLEKQIPEAHLVLTELYN